MIRTSFVSFALVLTACGGSSFSPIDGLEGLGGAGGVSSPDASTAGSPGSGGSNTGTSGNGGSVSHGGAAGAVGTGGTPGTGGTGTGGTGGRPGTGGGAGSIVVPDAGPHDAATPIDSGSGPSCEVDSDCKLSDTCCGCLALGPNDKVPVCNLLCIQSACAAQQIHGVRCSQGKCVLAPDCDSRNVTCKLLPEACPPGEVQSVKGACWGGCVPASICRTVTDCKACEADAYLCARQEAQPGAIFRCVDVPAQCGTNPGCECASSVACLPPFSSCNASMSGKQLNCSCPTC